jgi:hypothetical protein
MMRHLAFGKTSRQLQVPLDLKALLARLEQQARPAPPEPPDLKVRKESKEMLGLKVRKVFKEFKVRPEQLVQPDQPERLDLLALAWRPEALLDNFSPRRHRPITTRLGELQSPAAPPHRPEDLTGTFIFNTYEHDSPFLPRTICLHLRRW